MRCSDSRETVSLSHAARGALSHIFIAVVGILMRVVVPMIMLTSAAIAARTVLVIMLVAMLILRLVPTHRRVFAHRHSPRWLRFGV